MENVYQGLLKGPIPVRSLLYYYETIVRDQVTNNQKIKINYAEENYFKTRKFFLIAEK
jgi:hypothetical protein